jgi:hypothetical protein
MNKLTEEQKGTIYFVSIMLVLIGIELWIVWDLL